MVYSEGFSPDLRKCADRTCYCPAGTLSLVSAMVTAKAGKPVLCGPYGWVLLCALPTQATEDWGESYWAHGDAESVNGDVLMEK